MNKSKDITRNALRKKMWEIMRAGHIVNKNTIFDSGAPCGLAGIPYVLLLGLMMFGFGFCITTFIHEYIQNRYTRLNGIDTYGTVVRIIEEHDYGDSYIHYIQFGRYERFLVKTVSLGIGTQLPILYSHTLPRPDESVPDKSTNYDEYRKFDIKSSALIIIGLRGESFSELRAFRKWPFCMLLISVVGGYILFMVGTYTFLSALHGYCDIGIEVLQKKTVFSALRTLSIPILKAIQILLHVIFYAIALPLAIFCHVSGWPDKKRNSIRSNSKILQESV